MGKSKSVKRIGWKVSGVVLIVLIVWTVLLGLGPIDTFPVARAAQKESEAYRAAGLPWTDADLVTPVAAEDNAATLMQSAFDSTSLDTLKTASSDVERAVLDGQWDDAKKVLDANANTLTLATEASKKPKYQPNRDWAMGPRLEFTDAVQIKTLVRLLAIRARLEAHTGQTDACIADLSAGWKLGTLIGQQPTLIHMLVQCAIQAMVMKAVENCAAEWHGDAASLERLQSFMGQSMDVPDFGRALRGEAFMGLTTLRNVGAFSGGYVNLVKDTTSSDANNSAPPPINPAKLQRTGLPTDLIGRSFATQHFRYWTKVIQTADQNKDNPMVVGKVMDAYAEDLTKHRTASTILEEILLPVFSQAGVAVVEREADYATKKALVSALLIQAKTGHFPTAIADLPGSNIDPFTKQPLKIKATAESLRVYSVGRDLVDNGGLTRIEMKGPKSGDQYDVVASYPPIATKLPPIK